MTPTPTAAAALSPPPAATGSPGGRPSSSATLRPSSPVLSGPSNTAGIHSAGISSAARISADQSLFGVEQQRAGGVGGVSGVLAGEP